MTGQTDDRPFCASPDAAPRAASFEMPAGACDTHFHVFPSGHEHRYVPDRSYTPPPLEIGDYDRVAASLGIARAVVVQPSVYGEDNTAALAVSGADPVRLRAVVSVTPDVTDAQLAAFHAAGARGIRVNVVDSGGMTFPSINDALTFTARIADLGWHIEFLAHVETFEDIGAVLAASHVPVVFGHLGYTKVHKGLNDPGYRRFLNAFEGGQAWVKLTGPYRISALDRVPYTDTADMARALIAANPDRLIWGSDWPHVRHVGVMPNDGALLEQLADWGCDAALRRKILVDNPAALYGFPDMPA
ncbi:amidohydrolase family protein [Tropicibacter oceani]|uniref:Amidohydrolase family protein n=1 Tax=Tropicibacter oceani TaxID=3058420 RepID=A0ABY8QJ00_9RHOB|nr:amidohydrolase family protein [Tropicibacter oceani]WGW04127.1 amidohydrolase family protein [Tropicibacter oceani]